MHLHKWPKFGNFVAMKRLIYLIAVAIALVVTVVSCGHDDGGDKVPAPVDTLTEVRSGAFDSTVHRMPTYVVPGRLKEIFNDTNDLQLQAAIANAMAAFRSLDMNLLKEDFYICSIHCLVEHGNEGICYLFIYQNGFHCIAY